MDCGVFVKNRILGSLLFFGTLSTLQGASFENEQSDPEAFQLIYNSFKDVPPYFALPRGAWLRLPDFFDTTDKLFSYQVPGALSPESSVGYRFYISDRDVDLSVRLAKSGFVKNGDVLIAFRKDWAGTSVYPQIQMGQSHAGLAFIDKHCDDNGQNCVDYVRNLDQPFLRDYLIPPRDQLLRMGHLEDGHFYKQTGMLHILRPRSLTPERRKNIQKWAKMLVDNADNFFPWVLNFNKNYLDPNLRPGDTTYEFVKILGQIALNSTNIEALRIQTHLKAYCSETIWALQALSNCDPDDPAIRAQIFGVTPAACIKPIFAPIPMIGDAITAPSPQAVAGMAEGPPMVIRSMNVDHETQEKLLASVFEEGTGVAGMSQGQLAMNRKLKPVFEKLKDYYFGVFEKAQEDPEAKAQRLEAALATKKIFNTIGPFPAVDNGLRTAQDEPVQFLPNYSPTSYGINALLPTDNVNREMDYVGTVAFSGSW